MGTRLLFRLPTRRISARPSVELTSRPPTQKAEPAFKRLPKLSWDSHLIALAQKLASRYSHTYTISDVWDLALRKEPQVKE